MVFQVWWLWVWYMKLQYMGNSNKDKKDSHISRYTCIICVVNLSPHFFQYSSTPQ
jgi:hypothetical protein